MERALRGRDSRQLTKEHGPAQGLVSPECAKASKCTRCSGHWQNYGAHPTNGRSSRGHLDQTKVDPVSSRTTKGAMGGCSGPCDQPAGRTFPTPPPPPPGDVLEERGGGLKPFL